MQDAEPARWLPLAAAAAELGISVDTARRRLREGQLAGEQRPTPQGFTWWVCIGAVAQVAASPAHRAQAPLPGLPELVALVDRLQRENRDLAGLVGSLQQRLMFAEDRIRALEAPREPSPAEIASAEPTASARVEVARKPTPATRAWWLRWLPA